MPTIADLLSVGHQIDIDGTPYTVRPRTLLDEGKFQRWLEDRAYAFIDRRQELTEDQKALDRNLVRKDAAVGHYEFDGIYGLEAQSTPEGIRKLLTLLAVGPDGQPMPQAVAEKVVERELHRLVGLVQAVEDDDPKAIGAALKTLGLPANFLGGSSGPGSSSSKTRRSGKRSKKSRR